MLQAVIVFIHFSLVAVEENDEKKWVKTGQIWCKEVQLRVKCSKCPHISSYATYVAIKLLGLCVSLPESAT